MGQMKIVIVADDIDNLDLFCCELFDKYDLHPFSDEHFTWADIEAIMPNLIILDTDIKNIDIFSVYAEKHKYKKMIEIPVLFSISANNTLHKSRLQKLGISTYITKPYNIEQIENIIEEHFG